MPIQRPWRALIVGSLGAAVADVATMVFDLPVHVGLRTLTEPLRDLVAALCGGLCAVLMERALREAWHLWR